MSDLGYWNEDKPKCPHCGDIFPVWEDDNPLNLDYEDGSHNTMTCGGCGKDFVAVLNVAYTFSTAISDEAADDEIWGPQEADAA